ncbi:Uncharacterised protein [Vibrio cholerae]|nr:Uncharacterised protein [Vibrio cholerae]
MQSEYRPLYLALSAVPSPSYQSVYSELHARQWHVA